MIISSNCGVEPNKVIPYLDILHEAIDMSNWKPDKCIIFQRRNVLISELDPIIDVCWEEALAEPVDCVPVEANDPLYILYTSGTTDKPKGIQRPTGGHLVTLMYTMNTIYGVRPDDVWWAGESPRFPFSLIKFPIFPSHSERPGLGGWTQLHCLWATVIW